MTICNAHAIPYYTLSGSIVRTVTEKLPSSLFDDGPRHLCNRYDDGLLNNGDGHEDDDDDDDSRLFAHTTIM